MAEQGLGEEEARARLARHGPNVIRDQDGRGPGSILLAQLSSPMVALLLVAAVVSGALGEVADAIAIGVVVVLNTIVGFVQEYRSERALAALRQLAAPHARVVRDGVIRDIAAAEVVPGDLLALEAGDLVAADARLVEASALRTVEAALTGESMPSEKSTRPVPEDAPLAERSDRVFMGTAVAAGTARACVTATGRDTELGRVAGLLATATEERTPLESRLRRVGHVLVALCGVIVVIVGGLGLWRGVPPLEVLITAVALAVAAVPEGLAAIVTVSLAIGVRRMAREHALVRRLAAIETLGSATVVCTDKTGTLTAGTMVVREVDGDRARVLDAAAACCDADLDASVGDPTELAILAAARDLGIDGRAIERERRRTGGEPFDSDRKRMSIRRDDGVLYVKGAPESVLEVCATPAPGSEASEEIAARAAELAARGLRVLAVAIGHGEHERDLELLGLVGMVDPPRPAATAAVEAARQAGIRTIMITGDHPVTARAIAREMGIVKDGEDEDERVHARATPQYKLELVRALKQRGEIVAMTGDGVNDAPALREAHIGVAMGKTGTEVTREASDMVLTTDDFASIVSAVREGRTVFANLRKTLVYLLSGNAGELAVMLVAGVAGWPVPLTPLMLLWINLVSDSAPALALVLDPPEADVLRVPPRRPDEPLLGGRQWIEVLAVGALEATLALGAFVWLHEARGLEAARTVTFTTLVCAQLFRAFAARSERRVFFQTGVFSNVVLLVVVFVLVALQASLGWWPATRATLELAPLSLPELGVAMALGLVSPTLLELRKLVLARRG